jgi:hypothetical protein
MISEFKFKCKGTLYLIAIVLSSSLFSQVGSKVYISNHVTK